MGWLELLSLLKRVLPLLTRVAPMLETYVGGRLAGRDDSVALERIAANLKHDLAATSATQRTETQAALAEQASHLRELTAEIRLLRVADDERSARLADVQQRLAVMQTMLRVLAIGMLLSLIALAVALLRH